MPAERPAASYYNRLGSKYIDHTNNYRARYHALRLDTAHDLLKRHSMQGKLFDFGCGSGDLFHRIADLGFEIFGCDISFNMIDLASDLLDRHGMSGHIAIGGIEVLESQTGPLDVIVALNVLPYLPESEERAFYEAARRLLRPGGIVLVSHANALFDLVTFNRYTIDFYRKNLLPALELDKTWSNQLLKEFAALLTDPTYPPSTDPNRSERDDLPKRRADPFTYASDLIPFGLELLESRFLNCFPLPPRILNSNEQLRTKQLEANLHSETLRRLCCSQFQMIFRTHPPSS